jgi:hypothetical protein
LENDTPQRWVRGNPIWRKKSRISQADMLVMVLDLGQRLYLDWSGRN